MGGLMSATRQARADALPSVVAPDGDFDATAELWLKARSQQLWRRHSDAVNAALLARWLPAGAGRALKTDLWDEAVGNGLYRVLAARTTQVTAIDVSPLVVAAAIRRYPQLDGRCADVRALPFSSGDFDVTVSNSTLDHFDSETEILVGLRELHRVLRPGGVLILTLDNPRNPVVALTKALRRVRLNEFWLRHAVAIARVGLLPYRVGATLGIRALERVLPRLGFRIEDCEAIIHAPRLLAVLAAQRLERQTSPQVQQRFLDRLMACERLARTRAQFVTGHFVAVRATRI
jgi:SAM-dependent methyltransferase